MSACAPVTGAVLDCPHFHRAYLYKYRFIYIPYVSLAAHVLVLLEPGRPINSPCGFLFNIDGTSHALNRQRHFESHHSSCIIIYVYSSVHNAQQSKRHPWLINLSFHTSHPCSA